ncbi:uncharacterized protein LOC119165805 isoform X2 [Rhipicephalus microplus]|uniref:uncharacterized protein LOC119165805 isoform X2 n=1 Tax=Rhipicephalus microplus TaxID=6941 RepID=UPI003F6B2A14
MKLLTVMSVVYCISFAKAKTSWVPQEYKEHLNLKTFLTTTGGIYTVLATSETRRRLCKVDYDINVTDTQVYFNRSYTPGQEGPSAESLVGTFFGDLEEPTIMLLKTTDGADRGAEQLVHQDDEHKCGILFAVRKQIFANHIGTTKKEGKFKKTEQTIDVMRALSLSPKIKSCLGAT